MIKFANLHFLEILIRKIAKYNINKIYICAGYKSDIIFKKFHKKKINLVDIEVLVEKKPLGTGGCLKKLEKKISNYFFILNGDTYFDINLNNLIIPNHQSTVMALTDSKNYKTNYQLTSLDIENNKRVFFSKKSQYFNAGIYFFNKKKLKEFKNKYFSFEKNFLEEEIKKKRVIGIKFNNFFIDIGTPDSLRYAKKNLIKYLSKPAIFLDRDNTLIYDKGYTFKIKDLRFIKKTINYLKMYNYKFFIFIVTNQSGIGRGYFSEDDFYIFQKKIKFHLNSQNIFIDDVKFCPYFKKSKYIKYRKNFVNRKPNNGMIKQILNENFINTKKSFMIGNSVSDKLCAEKSKIKYLDIKKLI